MHDDGAVGQPPVAAPEVLFFENGATWYWLLAGPLSAAAMLTIQLKGGMGFQWFIPTVFLVLVTGFLTLQVKAARIHTSVELTRDYLRQGTETIKVASIVRVLPPAQYKAGSREAEKWQAARALGELTGVPRGRTGIGIELTHLRTAQAWARRHEQLREILTRLVDGEDVQDLLR